MKQKDYVIEAMRKNGGYATLRQLNALVDVSTWGTKTPFASIRRIVQVNVDFVSYDSLVNQYANEGKKYEWVI